MPKTTVVVAKGGGALSTTEHQRGKTCRRRRWRRGATKLGWRVKEQRGVQKKKERGAKRAQGLLCVLVGEESKWDWGEKEKGVQGSRGGVDTSEQSRKLAEGKTHRKERARA